MKLTRSLSPTQIPQPMPTDEPIQHEGTFTWTSHPARERVGAAAGALSLIVFIALVVAWQGQHIGWGVLAAVFLILSLNRFFFPSEFVIDDDGIKAHYALKRQTLTWNHVRRVARDARGVFLSTSVRPSRFDAFRGLHIQFGKRRDDVLAHLRSHLMHVEGAATWAG